MQGYGGESDKKMGSKFHPQRAPCLVGACTIRSIQVNTTLQISEIQFSSFITVDVSCKTYRSEASKIPGAAASKAEARKTRECPSKADGKMTVVLPAAVELSGRWGDGIPWEGAVL